MSWRPEMLRERPAATREATSPLFLLLNSFSSPKPPPPPHTHTHRSTDHQLERVENRASPAGGGGAPVDSGAADGGGLPRSLLLAAGDGACLLAFAAIGRASHGEPLAALDLLTTAGPFLVAWYGWGLSGWGGAFGREARLASPGAAAATVLRAWLPFVPTSQLLRAASVGHVADVAFWGISGAVTLVFLVVWRSGLSAVAPAPGAGKRADKKGNVLEFLSLIKGLTTRW